MMKSCNFIWSSGLILVCYLSLASLQGYDDLSDLRGTYCAEINCCNDRRDSCSRPILGTLCYCDEFCNRTEVHDCCPDYWSYCWGLVDIETPPPPTTPRAPPGEITQPACYHNGVRIPLKDTVTDNCRKCTCEKVDLETAELRCETDVCLIENDMVYSVNADSNHGWTAKNYSKFWGETLQRGIIYRLGTIQPQKDVMRMNPVKRYYDPLALPRQFDSVQKWPRYITGIQDQGWCGSSWAFSTAAVASDRFGIISRGLEEVQLSPQNIISCISKSPGCLGGRLDRAWSFVKKNGIVDEACFPYTPSNSTTCHIRARGPLLAAGCVPPKYSERKSRYKVGPAYRLGNETDVMDEILKSGPVQATMKVYHDFFSYGEGIYRHTDLSLAHLQGYHSVRIVGWGEEFTHLGPQKYWKVANSWGTDWGENGYFRILRGNNECDIESFVLGVWSEVERKILIKSRQYISNDI